VGWKCKLKVNAMTEFQKIAIGLLGMTHPEIHRFGTRSSDQQTSEAPHRPRQVRAGALVRAAKFAFAALVAGSRSVPLGDNGKITRELGAYGARLRCS
jgi:hypothetical protein